MFKSLKWKFITRMIMVMFIVILANRFIAQLIVSKKITERVLQQIEVSLAECEDSFLGTEGFRSCFEKKTHGNILKVTADYFVYCDKKNQEVVDEKCNSFESKSVKWKISNSKNGHAEVASLKISGDTWYAISPANDANSRKILFSEAGSHRIKEQIWDIRDETTLLTLPFIIFGELMIGLYLFKIINKPILEIKHSLGSINENTLTAPPTNQFVYKEFTEIVKQIEVMRKELSESFNKAKRFTGNVAHELRTPLTSLRGNAEELGQHMSSDSEQQFQVLTIADEIERIINITDKLLMISRADAHSLIPSLKLICLSDLINYWVNDASSFSDRLKITSHIQPDVYWKCDVALIRLLISNLYENAAKYNIANGWIDFNLSQKDGVIHFTIQNPCAGITSDLETLAFERFYRGNSMSTTQVEGTGLGLSLCFEIAKIHNASLKLKVKEPDIVVLTLTIAS